MDEHSVDKYNIYLLVRNQVRLAPMGEIIDLDHTAVLRDIELYVGPDEVKKIFEFVVKCFNIEKEFRDEFSNGSS